MLTLTIQRKQRNVQRENILDGKSLRKTQSNFTHHQQKLQARAASCDDVSSQRFKLRKYGWIVIIILAELISCEKVNIFTSILHLLPCRMVFCSQCAWREDGERAGESKTDVCYLTIKGVCVFHVDSVHLCTEKLKATSYVGSIQRHNLSTTKWPCHKPAVTSELNRIDR